MSLRTFMRLVVSAMLALPLLSAPNRPTIELAPFDPAASVVVADLRALLAGANVEMNQPELAFGCMSAPNDADCAAIMASFGLPFAGAPSPGQTLFRIQ